jgi:hypothetical protein
MNDHVRMLNNIRVLFSWVVMVAGMLIGCSLAFGAESDYLPTRASGVTLLVVSAAAMGPWLLWCYRIAVRERTYIECDTCHDGRLKGRHRV